MQEREIKRLAEQFWQQGYLVLEHFFEDELMLAMHKEILLYFGHDPDFQHNDEFISKSATEVIPWFPQREGNPLFDQVENHSTFCQLTTHPNLKYPAGSPMNEGIKQAGTRRATNTMRNCIKVPVKRIPINRLNSNKRKLFFKEKDRISVNEKLMEST